MQRVITELEEKLKEQENIVQTLERNTIRAARSLADSHASLEEAQQKHRELEQAIHILAQEEDSDKLF